MKIASRRTVKDWGILSGLIDKDRNDDLLWGQAFIFFEERIKTRYIEPAEVISKLQKYDGEGFSIVAILCSTIEALETFRTGKIYKKATKNSIRQDNEYYRSQEVFESFLTNQYPFCEVFTSKELVTDFYENVRCSILHEATTRNGWVIRVNTEALISIVDGKKILNRNIFLSYIKEYIKSYKQEFMIDDILKNNLLRKIEDICNTS